MHTPDSHPAHERAFLRDVALLLGVPLLVLGGLLVWWAPWKPEWEVPADTDVFAVAEGTWDWTTAPTDSFCVARRHTVAFSPDRRVMTIAQSEPWTDSTGRQHQVAVYDIAEHSRHHLRGRIRGETRLTDDGVPVVWDLVLTSRDSYRWHRTDWSSVGHTAAIRRCPTGTPAVVVEADSVDD